MNSLTCAQADLLLELSLSGACKPDENRSLEDHLDACPACSANLDKARRLLGLLELHYQMPDRLARLKRRLRQEPRARRHPGRMMVRQFAALAALLLVTLGLSSLLMPWQADMLPGLQVTASVDLSRMKGEKAPQAAFVRDHVLRMTHPLSEIEATLSVTNTTPRPIRLCLTRGRLLFALAQPGGDTLEGILEPKFERVSRKQIPLQPGDHLTLRLQPIAEPDARVNLSRQGDYTLWIRYTIEWGEPGTSAFQRQTLEAPPVRFPIK
jgi:Putative zinc-finger